MPDTKQPSLFEEDETADWKKEWEGMPEFIQKDLTAFRTLLVHFKNQEDLNLFLQLIQQKITPKTKYIWYPKMEIRVASDKRYTDEDSEKI